MAEVAQELGSPQETEDPATYAGRAVRLYYSDTVVVERPPAEFQVSAERTGKQL